jgi:hypothetical protein
MCSEGHHLNIHESNTGTAAQQSTVLFVAGAAGVGLLLVLQRPLPLGRYPGPGPIGQ